MTTNSTTPTTPISTFATTPVISAISDIQTLLNTIRTATSIDWTSPQFLDGVAVKVLAVIAIFHPDLKVGQWEPAILTLSVLAVSIESSIRGWLHRKAVSEALSAAQGVMRQKGNFGAS